MYLSAMGGYGMHDRWGDGGAGPWLGLLMMLAVAVAIGLAVWLLLNRRPHAVAASPAPHVAQMAPQVSPTANAEAILAERLARSEITPDDYRATIAALREQPPLG
jgi:uncharacterized membrane protein